MYTPHLEAGGGKDAILVAISTGSGKLPVNLQHNVTAVRSDWARFTITTSSQNNVWESEITGMLLWVASPHITRHTLGDKLKYRGLRTTA